MTVGLGEVAVTGQDIIIWRHTKDRQFLTLTLTLTPTLTLTLTLTVTLTLT